MAITNLPDRSYHLIIISITAEKSSKIIKEAEINRITIVFSKVKNNQKNLIK